ncbi:MAG: hypothetical protein KDD53_11620, partial [Bdellovibrionales bacterium]|nr:hypothetical protein [Bdellovibrionales bacterium]
MKIGASGMFSDDYGYLRKSIHYPAGDFFLEGMRFDKQNHYSGFLYPFVISPWRFIEGMVPRYAVVAFINSLLGLISVVASIAVFRELDKRISFLTMLLFFLLPPIFLFTFYALTENLLFPMIPMGIWFVLLGVKRRSIFAELGTFFVSFCAPLVRPPGLALTLALFAGKFVYAPTKRDRVLASLYVVVSLFGYFLLARYFSNLLGHSTEVYYADRIASHFEGWRSVVVGATLTLNQLLYIVVSVGVWPLAFLISYWIVRTNNDEKSLDTTWRCFCLIVATSFLGFLAFSVVHLLMKFNLDPAKSDFIYGRYSDPCVFLLLLWSSVVFSDLSIQKTRLPPVAVAFASVLFFIGLLRTIGWESETINNAGWFL